MAAWSAVRGPALWFSGDFPVSWCIAVRSLEVLLDPLKADGEAFGAHEADDPPMMRPIASVG